MPPIPQISDSEWEVLNVLWNDSPLTASRVHAALSHREWKPNTVRTFLTRLEAKGAIASEDSPNGKTFTPLLAREACVREASQSFLERVFDGATGSLLVHFAKSKRLSESDLAELQAIIDGKGKGKGK